jgi:thymidylate kinase
MSSDTRARTGSQLVVELVGTPGAGKTTAAEELRARCREAGLTAHSIVEAARPHAARTPVGRVVSPLVPQRLRGPLLWQVFYAAGLLSGARLALGRSPLVRDVVRAERARPLPAASKRHTLFWFLQLAGRRRFLARRPSPGEVLVIDDGFLHRAVALHASVDETPDPEAVTRYVTSVPVPDLVVVVHAPPEVCVRRIRARGIWRHRRGMSDDDLTRYVVNADAAVEAAVGEARRLGWRVIDVDNTGDDLDAFRTRLAAVADEVAR